MAINPNKPNLHLHRAYVGSVECGGRNISLDSLTKLASAPRCMVHALFPEAVS